MATQLQVWKIWASVEDYLTKWQETDTVKYGPIYCPCCLEWWKTSEDGCKGCPVAEYSGTRNCEGTPYGDLLDLLYGEHVHTGLPSAIEAEYRFLVDVALATSHKYQEKEDD